MNREFLKLIKHFRILVILVPLSPVGACENVLFLEIKKNVTLELALETLLCFRNYDEYAKRETRNTLERDRE